MLNLPPLDQHQILIRRSRLGEREQVEESETMGETDRQKRHRQKLEKQRCRQTEGHNRGQEREGDREEGKETERVDGKEREGSRNLVR